jgi:putative membrane protein
VPHLFPGLLLHVGGLDPTGWLWSDWNVEPSIAIGLLTLVAVYLYLTRQPAAPATKTLTPNPSPVEPGEGRASAECGSIKGPFSMSAHPFPARRERAGVRVSSGEESEAENHTVTGKQKACFIGGAVTIFIALGPPLDDWSDHYLLLAHMVQHLLLIMLAAPLLLIGTPAWLLEPLTRNRVTNAIGNWLTRPLIAFAVANFVFVLWHVPLLYDAALDSQPIHVFEHVAFLGAALIGWWPIVGPLPQWPRLPLSLHSLYLFAMTIPSSAVGAFITFADPGVYAPYDTAPRIFGIDLATDQQAAGLLMWVVVSAIYLLLITVSFFRWVRREEEAEAAAAIVERLSPAPASVSPRPGTRATS